MKYVWVIVFALLLASCAITPSATVDSPTQQDGDTQPGYPVPGGSTGYPGPDGANVIPMPAVTKDPTMGSVRGRILENGKPVEYADLYLAELLANEEGKEVAFAFDYTTSPRTQSDKEGRFEFLNLPAGEYGLVYDVVVQSVLLLDPNTGEQLKFVVASGIEVDAGDLNFSELPKP